MIRKIKSRTVKSVVNTIVGASVGFVVQTLIETTIQPKNSRDRVKLWVGSYVIGAMVADAANSWTSKKVDAVFKTASEVKKAWNDASEIEKQ